MVEIKIADLKFCPIIKGTCLANACMLWVSYQKEDGEIFQTCTFVLQPILTGQMIVEQTRCQAGVDNLREEVDKMHNNFIRLAQAAAQRSLTNGD